VVVPIWEWVLLVPAGGGLLVILFIVVDIWRRARKLPHEGAGSVSEGFGAYLADILFPFWRDWP
jgi:hypothetical protein